MSLHTHPHNDKALLSRYLDGDLQSDQSTAFEEHLKQCPTCRKEIKALRQTIDWIGQLRQIKAPEDFPQKVRQQVRRQRGKRRRAKAKETTAKGVFANRTSWLTSFLVVLVITLSIFLYIFGQTLGTQTTPTTSSTQKTLSQHPKAEKKPSTTSNHRQSKR